MTERELIKRIRAIVYEQYADIDLINELLFTYRNSCAVVRHTEFEILLNCAAHVFNVPIEMIMSSGQNRDRVLARQMIWKWLKINKPYMTFKGMAKVLNRTDHSNVICSINSITNLMEFDKDTRQKWEHFNELVSDLITKSK
jgi:chromosomal replication initiation ATPase DnaA